MATTFEQAYQPAQDRMFEMFGTAATYNGTDITVCIQGYDTTIEQYPEVWTAAATIDVRASEVPDPQRGDVVVLEGTTYQVGEITARDGLGATLALTRQMTRI